MKKQLLCGIIILTAGFCAFAGDAAAFVDVGISADGKTYVFGEYGKTDKTYQAYAEVYAVDIATNKFIPEAVFKTIPSESTASKSGKTLFDELMVKSASLLKKYNCKPAPAENLLYRRETGSPAEQEMTFQDFEGSTVAKPVFYHISVVQNVEGRGSRLTSSFFIVVEKKDTAGIVLSRTVVGSPDVKRPGVSGYAVNRIFSDPSGRNLVFIVEKTVEDTSGVSIRYMVETTRL
jgi:predicted secreted protein